MKRLTINNFKLALDNQLQIPQFPPGKIYNNTTTFFLLVILMILPINIFSNLLFSFQSQSLAQSFLNYEMRWENILTTQGVLGEKPEEQIVVFGENGVYFLPDYETALFELVNATRLEHDLPLFVLDIRLVDFAREKGEDMLSNGYIEHYSPRLGRPGQQASRDGIAFTTYGENLAGTLGAKHVSPEVAFYHLMESKYHREAILNDKNNHHLGIGVAKGSEDGMVYVMHFMMP
ncbi:MAG: CAP domain-containing protein [Syntrophales bacterium]|nr:CAP domain-containing protein [Syntrophales bacterium]